MGSRLPLPSARTVIAYLVATLGLVLPLLGFGVALAAESELGIPVGSVVRTPFDCLQLSMVGLQFLLEGSVRTLDKLGQFAIGLDLLPFWTLFGTVSIFLTIRSILDNPNNVRLDKARARLELTFREAFDPSAWPHGKLLRFVRIPCTAALIGLGGLVLQFLVFFGIVLAIGLTIVVLSAAPMIGLQGGRAYIAKYVVPPSDCAALVSRVSRLANTGGQRNVATCVEVCKEGKSLGKGRLAFSTASAFVLFNPDSGAALSVSNDGAVARAVADLHQTSERTCD
jgi:hypothetical protein